MSDPHSAPHGIQETPSPAGQHHIQTGVPHGPHGEHAPAVELPFTDEEWQEFQKSDVQAGKMIVALMGGIFVIGLLLYATIAGLIAYANGPIA